MSLEDLRSLEIFASSYRTDRYLRLEMEGGDPAKMWRLVPAQLPRPVTKVLDGGGVQALLELYGEASQLHFVGAVADSELIGLATWRMEHWNHMLWLCDIRVREEKRSHGVGSRLMEALHWSALREDAGGIMLETQNLNLAAIEFYRTRGFEVAGINTRLYPGADRSDPWEVALYMHRGLDG